VTIPLTKRLFDIAVCAFLLVASIPVMAFVAVLIKIDSPGPILFRQKRITLGAREFSIMKFRTMYPDFDKDARGIQIGAGSAGITRIGRHLRRFKIDELPQVFNVLRGEMSLVGPRPELPRRLAYYSEADKEIFRTPSGISSPASILFSDEEYLLDLVSDQESFYRDRIMPFKIALNRYYLEHRSFLYDLLIVVATVAKIFRRVDFSKIVSDSELLSIRATMWNEARREHEERTAQERASFNR
jgi:lipopolysaccharide/colanic/teichoic acid biosynthesis glycosyltransferase